MKKIVFLALMLFTTFFANAKVDVDFSAHFAEESNTINCENAWGWFSVPLADYQVKDAAYLYIHYEASCGFNLVLQNPDWQNAYAVTCSAQDTEAFIKLTPNLYDFYSCIVIQNQAAGLITIDKLYFCSEDEFFNPAPENQEDALENLGEIYYRYQKYLELFEVGDNYGQYPTSLYNAFAEALDAALIIETAEGQDLSAEQLNALSQAIVDTYRALAAAKKLYLPENGFYRFLCARQFFEGDEENGFNYFTKGLYCDNNGTNGWKTVDRESPSFLWSIERQEDNSYILRNAATGLIFSSVDKCSNKEASVAIDVINKTDGVYDLGWELSSEEDILVFNFRFKNDPADDYKYIHMNWHNNGAGAAGPLTQWCRTTYDSGASEWFLEPVSNEEVQEILNSNNAGFEFTQLLADAKAKVNIANDMFKKRLIMDASQFSSPYSQNDLGDADGSNLSSGVLIDGNVNTYWHTYWQGGNAESGLHYLQIEMPEEITGDIEFDFSRRTNASSDHVTKWGIYGSAYPDGEKEDYDWITDLETPFGSQYESIQKTFKIDKSQKYQYLRFYAETTNGGHGYWHVSEFQLYSLSENPNNQASKLGELYTNLVEAIKKAEALDPNAITNSDLAALKMAYEPFIAKFVDPTELRTAIEQAASAFDICEIGTNPGQWTEDAIEEVKLLLAKAEEYDHNGDYTQEQTDTFIAQLGNGKTAILAAANKVLPEKQYTIRFASEDKYDEQGWSFGNVLSEDWGNLFDTYLCAASAETLEQTDVNDIRQSSSLCFINNENADIAFRFIPTNENKYIIQHVASGLYIQCHGRNGWTDLSLNPTLFTVEAVGYGENIIRAYGYDGKDLACLHAALDHHRLVTWGDDYAGCNSGLIIEELEEINELGTPLADYKAGEMTTMCYPVSVKPNEGTLFTVAGTYAANDKFYIALNEVKSAEAGQPVVFINSGVYDAENENDVQTISLIVGTEIATEPKNDGALQGVYDALDLENEVLIFANQQCVMSTAETTHIDSNHAYLLPNIEADSNANYSLVIEVGSEFVTVKDILDKLAKRGMVYDANGRLVRSGATLKDVHSLPRGMYIFNDTKVFVRQ